MCGICAISGKTNVVPQLLAGLKRLEYRGYDSCGMVTLANGEFSTKKDVGSISKVDQELHFALLQGPVGLAHTRWATHGSVTKENAHPLFSDDQMFAVVHNGVIDNYQEIKKSLLQKGYRFRSETDTEVIAHLLQEEYKTASSVLEAFTKTIHQLEGCYALAMLSKHEPEKIFGAKLLLPMILGIHPDFHFLSSDASSFTQYTKQAIFLEDEEYFVLDPDKVEIFSLTDDRKVERKPVLLDWQEEVAEKGGYQHFMIKEISEQPEVIMKALSVDQKKFAAVVKLLHENTRNFFVGVGTTYYMALCGSYLFRQIAHQHVASLSSDEFIDRVAPDFLGHGLFISQSGETYDTKEALRFLKSFAMPSSAIVNNPASSIARSVDQALFQFSGPEICVVSTKASIAQFILLERLATALGIAKGLLPAEALEGYDGALKDFARSLSAYIKQLTPRIQQVAAVLAGYQNLLCMGKGLYYPIAMEAALKIKEVAYLHAEGMPTGFLKHGTLALVDAHNPCLFFMPSKTQKKIYDATHSAIEEVKARDGVIFAFLGDDKESLQAKVDHPIDISFVDPAFYPVFQLIASQLLAYYLALALKRPIDQPRNLAKSVTVP